MELLVHDAAGTEQLPIATLVEATVQQQSAHLDQLSVSFVDAEAIQAVNREMRGKDAPTDVLSFPYDDKFPQGVGGEVLICPEIVHTNATATGRDYARELAYMLVHGVLHVLGHEDDSTDGAEQMDVTVEEVLRGQGL